MNEINPAFAFKQRLEQSADLHPECPPAGRGRKAWLRDRLAEVEVIVTELDVVDWFTGRDQPDQKVTRALARILEIDAAWLRGSPPPIRPKHDPT